MRALLLALLLPASPAAAVGDDAPLSWAVGEEREVSPNNYAQLVEEDRGWRLWRFSAPRETVCVATKGVAGKWVPVPNGDGQSMRANGPYLALSAHGKKVYAKFWGSKRGGWAKYRLIGERFWTDEDPVKLDLRRFDGRNIEVTVTSFQYPKAMIGPVINDGIIDLEGYASMYVKAVACARKK